MKNPLVRIEHQRVGTLDAGEPIPAAPREHERSPIGRIDVKPQLLFGCSRREIVERIDRAGIGRAGTAEQQPRAEPAGPVAANLVDESVRVHSKAGVAFDVSHDAFTEPGNRQRFHQAVMRVRRQVNNRFLHVG